MHINCYIIFPGEKVDPDLIERSEKFMDVWTTEKGYGDYTYPNDARVITLSNLELKYVDGVMLIDAECDWATTIADFYDKSDNFCGEKLKEMGMDLSVLWLEWLKEKIKDLPPDTAVVVYPYHT